MSWRPASVKSGTSRRHRSASSWSVSHMRRRAWLTWRSSRFSNDTRDALWLLFRICRRLVDLKSGAGLQAALPVLSRDKNEGRQRDLFPLPILDGLTHKPSDVSTQRWHVMREVVNHVISSLNWLYGIKPGTRGPCRPTAGQTCAYQRLVEGMQDFVHRLSFAAEGAWQELLPAWVTYFNAGSGQAACKFDASRVDCLQHSGTVDPQPHLPAEMRQIVDNPTLLFPSIPRGLEIYADIKPADRLEYIHLSVKQLRSRKLGLVFAPKAGGEVFCVGKRGKNRLREVWHGSRASAAALDPPTPPHLCSPTALASLLCPPHGRIHVSKRDGKNWFDQLLAPISVRPFFGRPRLTRSELIDIGGLTNDELVAFLEPGVGSDHDTYAPVSRVWPMGFSFSSLVAQHSLLSLAEKSGLREDSVLASDAPTPSTFDLVYGAATDDLMIFSTSGADRTRLAAQNFDAIVETFGGFINGDKSITGELNATCVGVELENGTHLGVPYGRCLCIVVTCLFILDHPFLSPQAVEQFLGMLQWYDLLHRPLLSVLDEVYSFVGTGDFTVKRSIPGVVLAELAVNTLLGAFWKVDLRRPFLPILSATDASTDHGLGASYCNISPDKAQSLSRLAEKKGGYVLLDGERCAEPRAEHFGERHQLDLSIDNFAHIFSIKVTRQEHINMLEGRAFVAWLRWIARSCKNHFSRVVVLVDSAVWLGACAKGRSSSRLNTLLRKVCAITLVASISLHLVFVPSSHNPADLPSRGVRSRGSHPHRKLPPRVSKLEEYIDSVAATYRLLRERGLVDSCSSGDSDDDCSAGSSF